MVSTVSKSTVEAWMTGGLTNGPVMALSRPARTSCVAGFNREGPPLESAMPSRFKEHRAPKTRLSGCCGRLTLDRCRIMACDEPVNWRLRSERGRGAVRWPGADQERSCPVVAVICVSTRAKRRVEPDENDYRNVRRKRHAGADFGNRRRGYAGRRQDQGISSVRSQHR